MRGLNKLPSRILGYGVVLLVLGFNGFWYWDHIDRERQHLQERNFRALTVTSHALSKMVVNYGTVFKTVIEGEPPCDARPCPEEHRRRAYEKALLALQAFQDVNVTKETYENEGFAAKFVYQQGVWSIRLARVNHDRTAAKTRWKIQTTLDIGPLMGQLVTEDVFSDVLLADRTGRVLYHHQSMRNPSGFKFEDVSALLHRPNDSELKDGGAEKGRAEIKDNLVSTLPLFNEAAIGGISHAIFAQAMDLLADRGTAQTLILVGIVPARQFHAEANAIPLNYLLLGAELVLILFFALPYAKLRTNVPTERLTPISVVVLIIFTVLGTAELTFGLADVATYINLEQHLNTRLKDVSEEIRKRFNDDIKRGLDQLAMFDQSCRSERCSNATQSLLAQRLCIRMDEGKEFVFFQIDADECWEVKNQNSGTKVVYPDVKSIFWVGSTGELKVVQSREPDPWKYANLKERQYVSRVWEDETFTRDQQRFWIQPIYSLTSGENSAVLSMKSTASEGQHLARPIVAALEVKVPSVTNVGVPPGMGFAVINQEGEVLFHSDARRNLRENLFEETDRDGLLRQAVFARATAQFYGRYWGKDRHFHIAPIFFEKEYSEPPDEYWSLVTYWDADMLRVLNFRALYSSGALFLLYALIALSIGIVGWWMYSRTNGSASRWVWPQSEYLHHYQTAVGLLVASLVAVCIWFLRPHPYPDMLLWGLLPALVASAMVLSIAHAKTDLIDRNKTDVSARLSYRRSYALVVTLIVLLFVVIPALVIFRVAVDAEWRLLVKFAQFDLAHDRAIQAQEVRRSYPSTFFHDTSRDGEVRKEFLQKFSGPNYVYANFPFQSNWRDSGNRDSSSDNAVRRGDERLIRWLYHAIERPPIGHSGTETDMFLKAREQWQEPEWGTLRLEERSQATISSIGLESRFSTPIPQWLYSLLVFGGLAPLGMLRVKKIHAVPAVICVLGVSLLFGLIGEALAVMGVSALLYATCHVLPTFAAQRVLLLDFSHPSIGSKAGAIKEFQPPDGCSSDSWKVFAKEMSALRNVLCLTDEPTFRERFLKQEFQDDSDIIKERIIGEVLERVTQYYVQIWKNCTESQRRSLFNLARDGFLHITNPDIGSLLESGLIVADLNLRPMNESFRRFIIRTGLEERLDQDIAQAKTGAWFQVWRPIGLGLVLIMVFLVLTQEQYRAITLAFLGALPALLGAFSQAFTSSKKEKGDTAPSA